jgi:hypothetical protein
VYTGGDFKNGAGNRFVAKNSDNATSVGRLDKKPETFLVYPNPFQSTINIKSGEGKTESPFLITDQTGKSVSSGSVNADKTQIDLGNIPAGNYFLNIGASPRNSTKVIKN